MVLAASTQRTLGLAIVSVLFGGWLIYVLVANLRFLDKLAELGELDARVPTRIGSRIPQ